MRIPIWIAVIVAFASASTLSAAEELHLARFPRSGYQYVASQMLLEIYRQSELEARVVQMPPARANVEILAGRLDGEVSRIRSYAEQNPDLTLVMPSYVGFSMVAFSKLPVRIDGPADLTKYRIGIVAGVQASIELTANAANVASAPNTAALFAMLEAGRIDLAIDVDVNGRVHLAQHPTSQIQLVGKLSTTEGYHVLSAQRRDLAPRLAATISRMKASGELDRLRSRFEINLAIGQVPEE
jgi:polar amino acid transport system substrate-binding protein